ncbi:hypothetical protein AGMMS49960_20180 [Betaproteobacteria bacterium]|nr:hypothetical protein AGMMS49960_20180 [Betaproteobacteria bacterium]
MQEFEAQTRAFAAQIERELESGQLNFPTSMDVSLRIKKLADDPESSIDDIVAVVRTEPVLSAKTIRMSNAMLLNPYGAHITSVNNAVKRIGLAALRCLAFAVAAEQLTQDKRSKELQGIASALWRHSVDIASWSYAFAHHLREQFLFGSSYTFRPIGQSIEDFLHLGFKDEVLDDLFYGNAARLFGLK